MLLLSGLAIVLSLLCIIIFSPLSFSMLSSVFVSLHVGEFSGTLQTVNFCTAGFITRNRQRCSSQGCPKRYLFSVSLKYLLCRFCLHICVTFLPKSSQPQSITPDLGCGGGVDFSKLPLQGEKSTFITRVPSLCTTKDSRNWGSSKKKNNDFMHLHLFVLHTLCFALLDVCKIHHLNDCQCTGNAAVSFHV